MQEVFTYKTIIDSAESEFKDRGSKFLGYVFTIETVLDFKTNIGLIKELHPKATHHCFAYRLGTDAIQYRASDDGEPSGSAGRPILGAIDSLELTNVMAVVVRYYGGTMLGVPGLINAYKTCAKDALLAATIIEKEFTIIFELEFDYNLTGTVEQALLKIAAVHQSTENLLFCKKQVRVPLRLQTEAVEIFNKIHNLVFRKIES